MVAKKTPKDFESAMTQLEDIVQQLEKGDLPLESALEKYKEGIALTQYCTQALDKAEKTVATIMTENGEADFDPKGTTV